VIGTVKLLFALRRHQLPHLEPVFHGRILLVGAMVLAGLVLPGCMGRPEPQGPSTAESRQARDADREARLPSGATLRVPSGWKVATSSDGLTLEEPEESLRIELVEVDAGHGLDAAISTALARRLPAFNQKELAAFDTPGREGWDLERWARYEIVPSEGRWLSARAAQKGSLAVVVLVNGAISTAQRRGAEIVLVLESLRPAAYVRDTYLGRKPRQLDPAAIAQLKVFIERAREAADVPGLSVALFDSRSTFIEQGFGIRERGRSEPVTADTLYMIASNTKALTTLLLARLVDEGRFDWDTPVTRVYPRFKIGNPDATQRIMMKHLVCACTGLPRQDLEWLFTFHRSSPQEQLDLLATMQPTTEFGALYQYSNPLAAAAGYIGARAVKPDDDLGRAYDDVMRAKIFRPLGMEHTTFSFDEALRADHASPHSWNMALQNVPIDMAPNYSIVPVRPAGGAWSSVKDYARYVRLELAQGRLPDGSTLVTEKNLLARRVVQVRTGENSGYGMGLWIENIKDVPVISHGGSLFGYKSNFFFVPDAGVGGVMLTNADSGARVAQAFMRRTLEVLYDGKPEAEEELLSGVRETLTFLEGQQRRWEVPADPSEVNRLAGFYRNPALGGIRVSREADVVVFEFGAWKSRMATRANQDGSISFISIDPGARGFEFDAQAPNGLYTRLRLSDPQHAYIFESGSE